MAARTASMLRGDTLDSTNSAGMRRSATNAARSRTSAVPASVAVEMPCEAVHLHTVATAEVGERVVRGDEHALIAARSSATRARTVCVERVERHLVGGVSLAVAVGVRRVERGERVGDGRGGVLPELDVHPDVRVVSAARDTGLDQKLSSGMASATASTAMPRLWICSSTSPILPSRWSPL